MGAGGVGGCHKGLEADLAHQVLVHVLEIYVQFLGHFHSFEFETQLSLNLNFSPQDSHRCAARGVSDVVHMSDKPAVVRRKTSIWTNGKTPWFRLQLVSHTIWVAEFGYQLNFGLGVFKVEGSTTHCHSITQTGNSQN